MKDSAYLGGVIEKIQDQEELSQRQLAFDLNVSPSMVSHYKNDRRKMRSDVAKNAVHTYRNNYELAAEIIHEFSDRLSSPVMEGKSVERHRMCLEEQTEQEMKEALQKIDEVSLSKPPSVVSDNERESIKDLMKECLDAKMMIDNFLMILEKDYNIYVSDVIKERTPNWKVWGLI